VREVFVREPRRREQTGAVQQDVRILLENVASLQLFLERFLKRGQVFGETREAELFDRRRRLWLIGPQKTGNKPGLAELDEGQPRRGGARESASPGCRSTKASPSPSSS
jgi:hypothetical protein